MPIPDFNEHGLLPPGRHQCTLLDIQKRLTWNSSRRYLWGNLEYLLENKILNGPGVLGIFVDGSFVTDKEKPGDIDVIVVTRGRGHYTRIKALKRQSADMSIDVFPWHYGSDDEFLWKYFQRLKQEDAERRGVHLNTQKGILLCSLGKESFKTLEGEVIMPEPPKSSSRVSYVREVIQNLQQAMGALRAGMERDNMPPDAIDAYLEPYQREMERLYGEDLVLAKLMDESDLFIKITGEDARRGLPSISMVGTMLKRIQRGIVKIAQTLRDLPGSHVMTNPKERIEPGLLATAPGSLYVGFKLPSHKEFSLLMGEEDPVYMSTRQAMHVLGESIQLLAVTGGKGELDEINDDPVVQDAILSTVRSLTPDDRKDGLKIDTLSGGAGKAQGNQPALPTSRMPIAPLTASTRQVIKDRLKAPAQGGEWRQFKGIVRAIDLDEQRLTLRQIEGGPSELVCALGEKLSSDELMRLVDKSVEVGGPVKLKKNKPRLLQVEYLIDPSKQN